MNKHYLLGLLGIVLVVGIVVSAGVIVNFEHPQTGKYRGPGLPMGKEYSFVVNASSNVSNSYYAIPIFMNNTDSYYINLTIEASTGGNTNGEVFGLMNQSEYNQFTSNVAMNYLVKGAFSSSGVGYSYKGNGMQTFYSVFVNELNTSFNYISLEIIVTVIQNST